MRLFLSDSLQCNSNYVYNGVDTFLQQQPTHSTFFTIPNVFKKYLKLHFDLYSIIMFRDNFNFHSLGCPEDFGNWCFLKIQMLLQKGFGFIF